MMLISRIILSIFIQDEYRCLLLPFFFSSTTTTTIRITKFVGRDEDFRNLVTCRYLWHHFYRIILIPAIPIHLDDVFWFWSPKCCVPNRKSFQKRSFCFRHFVYFGEIVIIFYTTDPFLNYDVCMKQYGTFGEILDEQTCTPPVRLVHNNVWTCVGEANQKIVDRKHRWHNPKYESAATYYLSVSISLSNKLSSPPDTPSAICSSHDTRKEEF